MGLLETRVRSSHKSDGPIVCARQFTPDSQPVYSPDFSTGLVGPDGAACCAITHQENPRAPVTIRRPMKWSWLNQTDPPHLGETLGESGTQHPTSRGS